MLEQKLRDQQNDYFNFFEFLKYFVAIGSARRGNFSRQLYRNKRRAIWLAIISHHYSRQLIIAYVLMTDSVHHIVERLPQDVLLHS